MCLCIVCSSDTGVFKSIGTCARLGIACALCISLLGPIFLIIGIVLFSIPNDRAERVAAFHDAIRSYDPAPIAQWAGGGGDDHDGGGGGGDSDGSYSTVNGERLSLATAVVPVVGTLTGVNTDAVSRLITATLRSTSSMGGGSSLRFVFGHATNVQNFTANGILLSRTLTADAICERDGGCTRTVMNGYCRSAFGPSGSWVVTGQDCTQRGTCSKCTYTGYLSEYCIVLEARPSATTTAASPLARSSSSSPSSPSSPNLFYSLHPSLQSCFHPFTAASHRYKSTTTAAAGGLLPVPITVSVRKADDPFIALERLTEGSGDFGLTAEAQYTVAAVFVSFGALLTIALIAGIIFYCVQSCRIAQAKTSSMQQQQQQQHISQTRAVEILDARRRSSAIRNPMASGAGGARGMVAIAVDVGGGGAPAQGIPMTMVLKPEEVVYEYDGGDRSSSVPDFVFSPANTQYATGGDFGDTAGASPPIIPTGGGYIGEQIRQPYQPAVTQR